MCPEKVLTRRYHFDFQHYSQQYWKARIRCNTCANEAAPIGRQQNISKTSTMASFQQKPKQYQDFRSLNWDQPMANREKRRCGDPRQPATVAAKSRQNVYAVAAILAVRVAQDVKSNAYTPSNRPSRNPPKCDINKNNNINPLADRDRIWIHSAA